MNIKSLILAITAIVFLSVPAAAQTRTVEHEYSEFDAISVSSGFKVTFVEQDGYNAKFKVSDALEGHVQSYVKARTLYIGIDEKSVSKEVKRDFKGKNSDGPVLEATVYMPKLNSITLSDDCTFSTKHVLNSADFRMDLTGSSAVNNLNVNAGSAVISAGRKARLSSSNVKADVITVNGEGNADIILEYTCKTLNVNNSGSAVLALNGQTEDAYVTTSGGARLSLSGKAAKLNVSGKGGSSKIDAATLSSDDVSVSLDGAELSVAPANNLSLDLGKGASVTYSGDPMIKIVKIQNSTVTRE